MSCGTTVEEEIKRVYFGLAIEAQKQIPATIQHIKKRAIVIAGPTGCGKSEFALMLADKIGGEIVSADSMQVYKGMDIGTAKPTSEEQLLVPHHLLDIRNINESFNVVDFYYEARRCCQQILGRGNIPIIVGGSGFYIHALLYGPPSGPPSVPEMRKILEDEAEAKGLDALYERLKGLDPDYASTVTKSDKQKIVRALEIIALTGKKVSRMSWKTRIKPLTYDFRCWFLNRPKEHLYKRIDKRCDKMLEEGFLAEVERLEQEGLRNNTSAAQAIGYRQALDYLQGDKNALAYQKFVESFKQSSRNYAKRQITWFRKEPLFRWLDLDLHDYEVAVDMIHQDYQAPTS
ncbi:MAG: tRNA (adenosine(37)-N6)-dimethylallyltransferase MiaA [Parachlamydiaceae bacterium]|nr:tRNA (adenosine(37)-N6)-dimethylallyltransferase MiaA [Parachlamydiaceae bacterium]